MLNRAAKSRGVLGKWNFGADWWALTQWKIGISDGDAGLDKHGTRGNTRMLLVRLLWM